MREIEILEDEKNTSHNETIKLPDNFVIIGNMDVNDIKIYIKHDVYEEIEQFSKQDTTHERGGILIGDYAEVNDKKHVIISAFIEAKYTDASASTLTFTHETWNYIHSEQEKLYPEKKILGWQHTHPSYGIFLSNYDIFIQENFFNLPWQIAYVVDPISETRGFFQWKNEKVDKTNSFYIFDDVGKKIKMKESTSSDGKSKIKLFSITMIGLTIILCALIAYLFFEKINIGQKFDELLATNAKIVEENDELSQKLKQSNELAEQLQQSNEFLKESKENDSISKTTNKSDESSDNFIKMKVYIIQNGDTLNEICQKNNIDYIKNKTIILRINEIENEDKIYCGQKLYLPLS